MKKTPFSPGPMAMLLLLLLVGIFHSNLLVGQSGGRLPLRPGDTIEIELDSTGRMKNDPGSFAMVAGGNYTIHLCVDLPESKRKELWDYVAGICDKTLKDLDKNAQNLLTFYSKAKIDEIKKDCKELRDILKSDHPLQAFSASKCDFRSFYSSDNHQKQLLDEILFSQLKITVRCGDSVFTGSPGSILDKMVPYTATSVEGKIKIEMDDLKKQFIRAYYNRSRQGFADILNTLTYSNINTILGRNVSAERDSAVALATAIKDLKSPLICDDEMWNHYQQLMKATTNVAQTGNRALDWMYHWIWYTGTTIRLNPLSFTDEALIPEDIEPEKEQVNDYNNYLNHTISLMQKSASLSPANLDYKTMNSLLDQRSSNSYKTTLHDKRVAENAGRAKSEQLIFSTINRTSFRSVDKKKSDDYQQYIYDAANSLKGNSFPEVISTEKTIDIVIVNLTDQQDAAIKEDSHTIDDRSSTAGDIAAIGDVFSEAFTGGSAAQKSIAAIEKSLKAKDYQNSYKFQRTETSIKEVESAKYYNAFYTSNDTLVAPPPGLTTKLNYTISSLERNGIILLTLTISGNETSEKISNQTIRLLDSMGLEDCKFFQTIVLNDLKKKVPSRIITGTGNKLEIDRIFDNELNRWDSIAKATIKALIAKSSRNTLTVVQQLKQKVAELDLQAGLFEYPRYLLPPAAYKANNDTTPAYRNFFHVMNEQTKASKVSLDLSVKQQKDSVPLIHFRDNYKVSSPHHFTASVGLICVFPFDKMNRTTATMENGTIKVDRDDSRFRVFAGLHYHIKKILLADDRPVWKLRGNELWSRFSGFAGVSFPDPLYNPMTGISCDIWTGVKANTGVQWYRYTSYRVLNNQLQEEKSQYGFRGLYVGLSIEPVSFAKLIGLINF
ncbi:hypothetical protein ACE38W_17355 [Chitinophaga sp. Hz27]|uniref:hypothetical protein n=1 Tax=Chitinophaga sp. Hz27 TaxID=3347169 RepID=UPI0035D5639D